MVHEAFPLSWPEGWPRVRPQDRKPMASWKRTGNQYRDSLITEMERMKAPSFVISCNVPLNARGAMAMSMEPLDAGVAVWFSKPVKEDWSWQDALGIHEPAPTEDRINDVYRRLAQQYHPDRPGGDIEMFRALTRHRDNALRWVTRTSGKSFDFCMPCDQFKEVRLNIAAIVQTLKAIRQIERCGTSTLMERAFKGFSALPERAGA